MRTISIITPIYRPNEDYLLAAYSSLAGQTLPHGWQFEWLVQEDGPDGTAKRLLPTDDRVHIQSGRHSGVSITRNLALSRAAGSIVKNLDQDDILTDGALSRDIMTIEHNPQIGWTTSRVFDLLPNGETTGFENDPTPGELSGRQIVDHWSSHNYRLPIHPTTLCIRRDLAIALGGWMAVPGSDDTGLLIAASATSNGWFTNEVGLLYRKWPGQASAADAHTEPTEWNTRMTLIEQRAHLLFKTGWQWH